MVGVQKAAGSKCSRWWNYSTAVGSCAEHPELCERCSPVITAMGFKLPNLQAKEPAAAAVPA
jgi:isoleucyl-tRNA synthetase